MKFEKAMMKFAVLVGVIVFGVRAGMAACDNECRHWKTFVVAAPAPLGTYCVTYKFQDCEYCVDGQCEDTVLLYGGDCLEKTLKQWSFKPSSTDCTLLCTLQPGSKAAANYSSTDIPYVMQTYGVFQCTDMVEE